MKGVCKYDTKESCNNNDDCGRYNGDRKDVCFKGKCEHEGDNGQSCKTYNDCMKGFGVDLSCIQGICVNRNYLPVGAPCTSNTECQYYCGWDHKCSGEPGHAGCNSDDGCPSGWYCNAGTCIQR